MTHSPKIRTAHRTPRRKDRASKHYVHVSPCTALHNTASLPVPSFAIERVGTEHVVTVAPLADKNVAQLFLQLVVTERGKVDAVRAKPPARDVVPEQVAALYHAGQRTAQVRQES